MYPEQPIQQALYGSTRSCVAEDPKPDLLPYMLPAGAERRSQSPVPKLERYAKPEALGGSKNSMHPKGQ